ncbi:MAG TPA: TonB-dependent receptor [Thauera sp.]|nr:TonB-dependent receptor [Thauera sp.]
MKFHVSRLKASVCAALAVVAQGAVAQESVGQTVLVSATRIDMQDQDAPYASEVHTREDIERSGARSLYDYLALQTSLQVTPSYGNRYTPQISMRGYGSANGHQNVVISVDGRRLNNIDMAPQLIGSISLADIERLEITKGSGAVLYGDGATAGSIQIYTRARDGVSLDAYTGNYGTRGAVLAAGVVRDRFDLSATLDHGKFGGFSDRDPTGHRDQSEANTWRFAAGGRPTEALRLDFEAGASRIDTRYPNSLSLAQFRDSPAMSDSRNYTRQKLDSDHWSLGADFALTPEWRIYARHADEGKSSQYLPSSPSKYTYKSNEISVQFLRGGLALNAGVQSFDGDRKEADGVTTKDNFGGFLHGQYLFEQLTVSAGVRRERVEYGYKPLAGAALGQEEHLTSWEAGANYSLSPVLSVFASYSDAFLSPDIDRFFASEYDPLTWAFVGKRFNGFIEPAKSRMITLGANHLTDRNRFKASIFYTKLKNEIYLEPISYSNTNIDKSHKYGFEIQNSLQLMAGASAIVNYAWTRAVIDRESDGGGAYNEKELPGVSRHSLVMGLNFRVADTASMNITHTWRSKAWADGDFDNRNAARQRAYNSTDLVYKHRLSKAVEVYGAVNNLFDRENGLALESAWAGDRIYPIDFERTWKIGARVTF